MKLATLPGGRDGRLAVVSRDLSRATLAQGIAGTLQDALDYKYIPTAKTAQEIAPLFDIVYKP